MLKNILKGNTFEREILNSYIGLEASRRQLWVGSNKGNKNMNLGPWSRVLGSWQSLTWSGNFLPFMEPKGLLSSQGPTTGQCPMPAEYSPVYVRSKFSSLPRSPKWFLFFKFSDYSFLPCHACYTSCPSHLGFRNVDFVEVS